MAWRAAAPRPGSHNISPTRKLSRPAASCRRTSFPSGKWIIWSRIFSRRREALKTPTDLGAEAVKNITGGLNALLADVFALYLKTKNFHWHVSGPHFRDYHLLLDEQAAQIFAMTDEIAERVRKIGGTTIRSIGHVGRLQRLKDNDAVYVDPLDMIAELREDN